MTQAHQLIELIRLHRLRWPLERIAVDPAGFRAECEQILRRFPSPVSEAHGAAGTLSEQWLELLFGDRPPEPDRHTMRARY
jgi:hypothetical protein